MNQSRKRHIVFSPYDGPHSLSSKFAYLVLNT